MILSWGKGLTDQKDLLPSWKTLFWQVGEGLIGTWWNSSKENKGCSAWGELPLAPGQDRDLRLTGDQLYGEQFGRKIARGSWSSCLPWGRNVPQQQNRPFGLHQEESCQQVKWGNLSLLFSIGDSVSGVMAPVQSSLAHERDGNIGASPVKD